MTSFGCFSTFCLYWLDVLRDKKVKRHRASKMMTYTWSVWILKWKWKTSDDTLHMPRAPWLCVDEGLSNNRQSTQNYTHCLQHFSSSSLLLYLRFCNCASLSCASRSFTIYSRPYIKITIILLIRLVYMHNA